MTLLSVKGFRYSSPLTVLKFGAVVLGILVKCYSRLISPAATGCGHCLTLIIEFLVLGNALTYLKRGRGIEPPPTYLTLTLWFRTQACSPGQCRMLM
jgi:hypothetical protein